MQTILITGGTGLVGTHLTKYLKAKGYRIHVYTRGTQNVKDGVHYFNWNPTLHQADPKALEGVSTIINLAGAGIADKRWTSARKEEIKNSRIQAGETLVKLLQNNAHSTTTLIQASGIGSMLKMKTYNPIPKSRRITLIF
jgi:uncharacterized protein